MQCCSCTRRSKTEILTTRAPPSWIEFDVVTSHRQNSKCFRLCNATWIDYLRLSNDFSGFYKRSINTGTWKSTITNHIEDVVFDGVTSQTSNSIQDGGTLVINILVFDLRVQLQHCTYQRKTLLSALIKVSTFICKREILSFSSPLTDMQTMTYDVGSVYTALENYGYF